MKVCVVGSCGHAPQALEYLRTRDDVQFCGFAPWSRHEGVTACPYGNMPYFENALHMLDSVQPDLAVVSPLFGLTGQAIIACAQRGIHVFSEKPVAASMQQLQQVCDAVRQSGIRFCAMHYLRYHPAFYKGAQLARQGSIGDIKLITAQKSYKYGTRPAWYGQRELYGGTIPWVGIHAIDWIYSFTGKRFCRVSAQSVGENPEMAAVCRFELENGIAAAVNIDYYRPAGAATHGDDRVRCVGTRGVLEIMGGNIHLINAQGESAVEAQQAPELLEEFLNGTCPLQAEEIFHITAAALAAREAADTGKTIEIGGFGI